MTSCVFLFCSVMRALMMMWVEPVLTDGVHMTKPPPATFSTNMLAIELYTREMWAAIHRQLQGHMVSHALFHAAIEDMEQVSGNLASFVTDHHYMLSCLRIPWGSAFPRHFLRTEEVSFALNHSFKFLYLFVCSPARKRHVETVYVLTLIPRYLWEHRATTVNDLSTVRSTT